jgi:hypothetical protein
MSAPFSVALPMRLRRRGEFIGLGCGLLSFPLAFFGNTFGALLPAGPAGVILPIVFFSAVAGIIGCTVGSWGESEPVAGTAPGLGIRAGIVATLAGGALTVFAATLHAFGIGQSAQNGGWLTLLALALPHARPFQVLVIALLGIPPAVFFGMAGGFITAMLRNPPPPSEPSGGASAARARPAGSALFTVIFVLSAVGYLSPFTISLRPKLRPIVVAPVVRPVVESPASAPPKWSYRKSKSFDSAEAESIDLNDRRTVGALADELPVALAPNGCNFAYCVRRNDGLSIEVHDLVTLDTIGRCSVAAEPTSFAWSPDSRRLLFVTEQRGRHLAVFDPAENRLYPLPQPKDARLPDGLPVWWESTEVLFIDRNRVVTALDLETLRAGPAEENLKWKSLSKEQQDDVERRVFVHLPSTPRWRMALRGFVHDYDMSTKDPVWRTNEHLQFALVHPQKSYARIFPNIDAAVGDSFVAAEDGTKLMRLRNHEAEVFYFDTRTPPSLVYRITMPNAPDSSLSNQLAKKMVCVFVCAPLINPLNGKTVGPIREQVKALGRIAKWSEKDADVWIDEEYFPVQAGDVIADLHTWDERHPIGAGQLGQDEWWTTIEAVTPSSDIPTLKEAAPLDRALIVKMSTTRGADRLESVEASRPRKVEPVTNSPPVAPPPPPAFIPPKASDVPQEVSSALLTFIHMHHLKSSRGDVDGMLEDYAERVDHFNHGIVDRNFIRKDELEYHAPGVRLTETLRELPAFERLADGSISASYTIAYERHRPDGHWAKGLADISLTIELTPSGPKIVRQRSQNYAKQQGP